jgi:hypothetical protein
MRILFAIPHYADPAGGGRHGSLGPDMRPRLRAMTACLAALHGLFGGGQCAIDIGRRRALPANAAHADRLDVVVCTTRGRHLLDRLALPKHLYTHHPTRAEPPLLGFECQAVLRDHLGRYDYYCFLEDDILLHDPWFFRKLVWFTAAAGDDCLLQPNRYEQAPLGPVRKAYIDGDLARRATARFQDVRERPVLRGRVLGVPLAFRRALNPHAASYFLSAAQMGRWARRPDFLDRDTRFVGPLESAATLGIMRTFRVYKPAPENADFLEVEHPGTRFLGQIGRTVWPPADAAAPTR